MLVLAKSNKESDADDFIGKSIALTLKSIPEKQTKEFMKYKIEEVSFLAQFGNLAMPLNNAQHHSYCAPWNNIYKAQYT